MHTSSQVQKKAAWSIYMKKHITSIAQVLDCLHMHTHMLCTPSDTQPINSLAEQGEHYTNESWVPILMPHLSYIPAFAYNTRTSIIVQIASFLMMHTLKTADKP